MVKNQTKTTARTPLAPLHRLEFILQHQSDQLLRSRLGVGFGQIRIMDELSNTTARSQREIASQLYQTEANISRQLRLLQKKGLVNIVRKPEDKRQRQVTLSTKGSRVYSQAQAILGKFQKQVLSSVEYRDAYNFTETATKLLASL